MENKNGKETVDPNQTITMSEVTKMLKERDEAMINNLAAALGAVAGANVKIAPVKDETKTKVMDYPRGVFIKFGRMVSKSTHSTVDFLKSFGEDGRESRLHHTEENKS